MGIMQLLMAGGVTLIVLAACSILSIAVIIERLIYYKNRSGVKREDLMSRVKGALKRDDAEHAVEICRKADTPFSNVVSAGLNFREHSEKEMSNNMERTIVIETNLLEQYTAIIGTIGSIAVYIGLFGTVLGIIKSFNDISVSGGGGISVVVNGIAESLICTAAGLCVAVPAVVAYNYFTKRIDGFITDMELCASETADIVKAKGR